MTDDLISFFGLTGDPFAPSPDATQLLKAQSQSQVIDQVLTDVATEPGVVTVRGHRGVGKTSVSQLIALALRLHGLLTIELTGGRQNPLQIQSCIGQAVGIGASDQLTPDQLARELPERLGRGGLVVVIDDAQHLTDGEYRYLLLLRAALGFTRVGFGLILVGSAGQWPAMAITDMGSLGPESMARHVLFPLRQEEAAELLHHRFRQAGRLVTDVLSPVALEALVREAEGVPGQLAELTAAALAAAYARRRRRVTLRTVWPSLSAESGRAGLVWRSLRRPAMAACLLLAAAAAAAFASNADLPAARLRLATAWNTVAAAAAGLNGGAPAPQAPARLGRPVQLPDTAAGGAPRGSSKTASAAPLGSPPPLARPSAPAMAFSGASRPIPAPPPPPGGRSEFQPIQATPLPPPAPATALAPSAPASHLPAAESEPGHEAPRGSPGLILVAGADDTLPALYARVYRGVTPPPYSDVLAANHSPVRAGDLLIFPEPPHGWPKH